MNNSKRNIKRTLKQTVSNRNRIIAANSALIAGVLAAIALFTWTMLNPRHLPPNTIYLIVFADYMVGLVLFVILLVRKSAKQPLDAPATKRLAHWESDFESWNTSLGIRILATEQQLQVMRHLFDLGNCIDSSVSPPRLDDSKRSALLQLIIESHPGPSEQASVEKQVLFSGLQYGDRHFVSAILRELRSLGNPSVVPRICDKPVRASGGAGTVPDIHFEEIRATAPQCGNVLSALAILNSDQDTLLRAASASSGTEETVLLRPAIEVETREDELLRSVDAHAKTPPSIE